MIRHELLITFALLGRMSRAVGNVMSRFRFHSVCLIFCLCEGTEIVELPHAYPGSLLLRGDFTRQDYALYRGDQAAGDG